MQPPPTVTPLEVDQIQLVSARGPSAGASVTVLSSLDPPSTSWNYTRAQGAQPNAVDITFSGAPLDNSTVTLGLDGAPGTFQVAGKFLIGAMLGFPATNVARLFVKDGMQGSYSLRLVGTADASSNGLAIMSLASSSAPASALDGEISSSTAWPSGDGQPGGDLGPIKLTIR
jgi:hypothetical protein